MKTEEEIKDKILNLTDYSEELLAKFKGSPRVGNGMAEEQIKALRWVLGEDVELVDS